MQQSDIDRCNAQYGRPGCVEFGLDVQGQARVELRFKDSALMVYLQGAHITACQLGADAALLWTSQSASYQPGKAIRGGIPLCWPWFGAHPSRPDYPQHGYARTSGFEVINSEVKDDFTGIQLRLVLATPELSEWCANGDIELTVTVRLSDSLWLQLDTHNRSTVTVPVSLALHSYFNVGDVAQISMPGLMGLSYIDKLRAGERLPQRAPLVINEAIDRIYLDPPQSIEINDPVLNRQVQVRSWGNTELVVWNPGAEGAQAMLDFDDAGYSEMVCVEPAIAADNSLLLMPGGTHTVGQEITSIQLGSDLG